MGRKVRRIQPLSLAHVPGRVKYHCQVSPVLRVWAQHGFRNESDSIINFTPDSFLFQSDAEVSLFCSLHSPPITHRMLLGNLFFNFVYFTHSRVCKAYMWNWMTFEKWHPYITIRHSRCRFLLLTEGFFSSQSSSPLPGTVLTPPWNFILQFLSL